MTTPDILGYHHIGLTVRDIDASVDWYTRTLGLVRAFDEKHSDGSGFAVILMRPGSPFSVGLHSHDEADGQEFDPRRTGLDHLSIAVSSAQEVDAWATYLDDIGVEHDPVASATGVIEGMGEMSYTLVHLRDPDGIDIELWWSGHKAGAS